MNTNYCEDCWYHLSNNSGSTIEKCYHHKVVRHCPGKKSENFYRGLNYVELTRATLAFCKLARCKFSK